jgi:hypothetical protein
VAPATGPNASLDQDQLEERRSRAAHPLAIFAATLLVVAVALGIWWFGRTTPDPTTSPQWPSQSDPTIVEVNDPLPELEAAPVTDNSQGDPVFAWDNPAPQAGDQYHWWLLSHQDQSQVVLQTHVGVARPDFGTGPVCIEVQLVRAERASQQVLRLCEE